MEIKREDQLIRWLRITGKAMRWLLITLVIVMALSILFVLYLRSQPLPKIDINETTTIYGADQTVIAALYKEKTASFCHWRKFLKSYSRHPSQSRTGSSMTIPALT